MQREREGFTNYWIDRMRSDLASFCDPGSKIDITREKRNIVANWVMHGKERHDVFNVRLDRGIAHIANQKEQSYSAFLAGPDMADLRHMALMVRSLFSRSRLFVDTQAQMSYNESNSKNSAAVDLLSNLVANEDFDLTRVVMVTGEPGSGKTQVLREFVGRAAVDYLDGKTSKLPLYVNAQGRALARLTEAFATELQDLKVGLTYHSIAALTRLGLLIPVIDGFDELLAVTGYDDAFDSLDIFLGELGGEGQLIASARSVYYEEEFRSRFNRKSEYAGRWEHVSVRVKNWLPKQREAYLAKYFAQHAISSLRSDEIKKKISRISKTNNRMIAKPLFLSRTVDLLYRNPNFNIRPDNLLGELVRGFLEREQQEKLLDRHSNPLLSIEQIDFLLCELAQEMWNQETRVLDAVSVREITEYVLSSEWDLPDSVQQRVIKRSPTLAFLDSSENNGNRPGIAFEHEAFFFYFLARSIVSKIKEGAELRRLLSRSPLAQDVAVRIASELRKSGQRIDQAIRNPAQEELQILLRTLGRAGKVEGLRTTQIRENSGLITMELLREYAKKNGEISDITIQSTVFPGGDLKGIILKKCKLADVWLRRTDLTETKFVNCEADDVYLEEPCLNQESTLLELSGLDPTRNVAGIMSIRGNKIESIYAPTAVTRELVACGLPHDEIPNVEQREVPLEYVELMERLLRIYRRSNPICLDRNTPATRELLRYKKWEKVKRLLLRHGIVEREERQTGGTKKEFLRRNFRPEQIMSGLDKASLVDSRVRNFWRDLSSDSIQE